MMIPNQLCRVYKLGIAGLVNNGLNRFEPKVAMPATVMMIIMQPKKIACWFFKFRFVSRNER